MGKKEKSQKTNVMRILDKEKISYEALEYPNEGICIDAVNVAKLLNEKEDRVYKTLVLDDLKGNYFVGVIPSFEHIDLKKFSKVAKVKKVELLDPKKLTCLTGYVRGGCSPIGMKKLFKTYIDKKAMILDYIIVSAGKIGEQIKINPKDLEILVKGNFEDITY